MRTFKSLEAVREASVEELAGAPSMNEASARKVYEFSIKKIYYGLMFRNKYGRIVTKQAVPKGRCRENEFGEGEHL